MWRLSSANLHPCALILCECSGPRSVSDCRNTFNLISTFDLWLSRSILHTVNLSEQSRSKKIWNTNDCERSKTRCKHIKGSKEPNLFQNLATTNQNREKEHILFNSLLAWINQPRINQPRINQPWINQPWINQPWINQPRINQPWINQPNLHCSGVMLMPYPNQQVFCWKCISGPVTMTAIWLMAALFPDPSPFRRVTGIWTPSAAH